MNYGPAPVRSLMTWTKMNVTTLSYERMVEDALRGVLREALRLTARQGLPGAHHFYITFDTTAPGVQIAASLKALHPNEMTIVLQHQFWDLIVEEERFGIALSFNGVQQHLSIPFAAVTAFADPHAKFGLQFHVEFEERSGADEDADADIEDAEPTNDALPVDNAKVSQRLKGSRKAPAQNAPLAAVKDADDDASETGKVVTLDAFRKK